MSTRKASNISEIEAQRRHKVHQGANDIAVGLLINLQDEWPAVILEYYLSTFALGTRTANASTACRGCADAGLSRRSPSAFGPSMGCSWFAFAVSLLTVIKTQY